MAFNPFLSMGEPAAAPVDAMNPFATAEQESAAPTGENPFATSNPFAELGSWEPSVADTVPADIFGTSPFAGEAKLTKPTELILDTSASMGPQRPPPPSRPLPPETQNLLKTVTGHMELTSSHLLDRIPPTRTPSPVSVRDLHSPSPTPEPDEQEPLDVNRNKPARPPPPPRPAPPAVPIDDDVNLFDAPVPPKVKPTKEAILSLYSIPKEEERQIDFLSDDILSEEQVGGEAPIDEPAIPDPASQPPAPEPESEQTPPAITQPAVSAISPDISTPRSLTMDDPQPPAPPPATPFSVLADTPMDCSEPVGYGGGSCFFSEAKKSEQTTPNNPFADQFGDTDISDFQDVAQASEPFGSNVFGQSETVFGGFTATEDAFATSSLQANGGSKEEPMFQDNADAFDAFSAKFDSAATGHGGFAAWGDDATAEGASDGFEAEAFDPFLSMAAPPPPAATPRLDAQTSKDSDTDEGFSVVIRPQQAERSSGPAPVLAPPPRAPPPRSSTPSPPPLQERWEEPPRDGGETPPTPLFDEDVSVPLEDFPRTKYEGPGWEMQLRQPNKKKITGQRFWKKVFVRLVLVGDNTVVQLLPSAGAKEPLQELPLQACYSVSDIGAQQFDQFGKIFTVKLQYVFYKERPGVRPGQVTKAERITNKLSQFAAYAIQGDYQGVKEFGSDLRKLGLPVEHAPQVSQLFKLGSLNFEDVKQFSCCIEEALFRLSAHRDRALAYKMEEVQVTAVDELYVEQDAEGSILKQIARVRLFFLGFLSGMPDVELGVNDLRRQGREVVGRHDIIPVVTEEWIRVEDTEFHACVQPEDFTNTQIIKFKPPDACYIELMRFRVRPPKNRELPLQLKAVWVVIGSRVELRADVLVPGFASRKLGQIPCEDVAIRFPIPECWIYLFRVEKHFRYGSVKSAHRRTGKIKGIERFLGAVDTLQESLIEVTSGQAKYEHQHRAIVWRMPRLPKEGQGAYTTHNLVCRMALTSYDQVPSELAPHAFVEFTMPATQVSHMTVRSISLQNYDNDPPEKYVRYLARHEYIVGIERTEGGDAPAYAAVTRVIREEPPAPPPPAAAPRPPSSDSDSD